jgi:hypothetical protein
MHYSIWLSETARGLATSAYRGSRAPAIPQTAFVNIIWISLITSATGLFKMDIILHIISRCPQQGYQNSIELSSYKIKNATKVDHFESLFNINVITIVIILS